MSRQIPIGLVVRANDQAFHFFGGYLAQPLISLASLMALVYCQAIPLYISSIGDTVHWPWTSGIRTDIRVSV
jgi:hypothetical protein